MIDHRYSAALRRGYIRAVQLLATGLAIHCIAAYGITSLTVPGYLLVIVVGIGIDRLDDLITVLGHRHTDSGHEN